jgi:hypothetical protein
VADAHPDGLRGEQVSTLDDLEAGSAVDDNPNCRGSPDDWPTQRVADDTNDAADDTGPATLPNRRDYSRRDALPSSTPNRSIPKGRLSTSSAPIPIPTLKRISDVATIVLEAGRTYITVGSYCGT